MTDDEDIYRQGHMMYAQANILFSLVCGQVEWRWLCSEHIVFYL